MSTLENFEKLGLSQKTLKALEKKGFTEPTPIQAEAIPILIEGKFDVVGQALTGTGKTAAFALPIIECLTPNTGCVQAIILTPTRELAMQLATEFESLAQGSRLEVLCVYGGQSIDIQLRKLRSGCDIVVGTPGRVMDLMERGALSLDNIEFAVLDEADEMLNMGFVEDIEKILSSSPEQKRMLLFSATMPKAIMSIAENFMREYKVVNVKLNEHTNNDLTEQIFYEVKRIDKVDALLRIIDSELDMYGIVFCRTRNDVDELLDKLLSKNIKADALHGDINQGQRTKVIENFKNRKFNILLATDVAARGIDVKTLTHVINFSIPENSEIYVHRIGRTGRAGNAGTAITFVTPGESRKIALIKKDLKIQMNKRQIPSGNEVVAKKLESLDQALEKLITNNHHNCYKSMASSLMDKYEIVDLIAAMLRNTYKNTLLPETYKAFGSGNEREFNSRDNGDRRSSNKRGGDRFDDQQNEEMVRLFFGCGKKDGVGAKKLLDVIFERTRIKSYQIGKVDCYDKFSYADVGESDAEKIISAFNRGGSKGKKIHVEYANTKQQ